VARSPCAALVKNRKSLARVACGRSGRLVKVSGQSFACPPLVLCSSHRKRESKRYAVEVVRKTDFLEGL